MTALPAGDVIGCDEPVDDTFESAVIWRVHQRRCLPTSTTGRHRLLVQGGPA